jgi:uncharacterized repeat protein (TIGR01451 family)
MGEPTVPTRRQFGIRLAAVAVLAAGAAHPAPGQAPKPPAPKYYSGKVTPNPAHQSTYNPPPARPQPGEPLPTPGGAAPRLTQPVVAGPNGVRPVSADDTDLMKPLPPVGDLPKPAFFPNSGSDPVTLPIPDAAKPPTVVAERGPGAVPVPPPLPGGPAITPPVAAPPSPPLAANLSARAAANVLVEIQSPDAVGVGQPCTYTLLVRNTGTVAVTGVRVDHEPPAGATVGATEPAAESAGDGKLAWAVGPMDAGAEKRIKVTVTPTEEGELRGRASVTFSAGVEARVKVTRPRIGVTLTGPDVVRVGEPVVFQVKLTNTGSGPANTMRLHARFTDGLKHANGQVIEGEMKNLEAGKTKTFSLEVAAARPGQETFVLSVFADANQPETAKAAVTLVEPQLVIKQTGPTKCLVRAEPVYQIDLTNPGSAATEAIQMWTAVPDGFEFVQASDAGQFNATSKTVVWRLNGLTAGGAKTVTVKLRAVAPADSAVRTTVQAGEADAPAGAGVAAVAAQGKPLEARAETAVKAEGVAALRFDLVGKEGLVEVGKEAEYEIKVVNHGTGPCTNVQLVAELADGTTMVASAGPTNGRSQGGQTVLFEPLPHLAAKAEAVYRMRVNGSVPGDMRFRVKLTCEQIPSPVVKEENTKFYKQ